MAIKPLDGMISVRIKQEVVERFEDCADAEDVDAADIIRDVLTRASIYRLNKLRKAGLAPAPRPYTKIKAST